MTLIIGNIIALIAALLMIYVGVLKKKEKILLVQTIQISLNILSNIILGGITGAIINTIGCIRNIFCYKNKFTKPVKIVFIIISIVLSLAFNNLGLIGLLPLISTVTYIWLMDIKDVIKFKYLIIFTLVMWGIYDFYIKAYTSSLFDFISIISNLIAIYQLKTKLKK